MLELKIKLDEKTKKQGLEKINLLRKVFDTISDITEEIDMNVSPTGITIQAIDTMQIMYGDIQLSPAIFTSFRCDRNLVLGIRTKVLSSILKTISMDKFVSLEMDCADNAEVLNITMTNEDCQVSHKLALYSFDKELFDVPEMGYDVTIKMVVSFYQYVQKSLKESDFLKIVALKDQLRFTMNEQNVESVIDVELEGDEPQAEYTCTAEVEKILPVKFFNPIGKCCTLGEHIELSFSDLTPAFIKIDLNEYGVLKFYIAPKDNEEDDD